MYAIITDGSRQYKVEKGQELVVDFRDTPAGEKLKFEKVRASRFSINFTHGFTCLSRCTFHAS